MSRLLQDKTRQDFFPRVPLPPSLLEFMHGVADGLGYLVMVLGYGELFYNSTFLRQAVAGRGTCSLQIVSFFKPPPLPIMSNWYLSPNTPEGHYNKRTLSKQQFRSGEHNPIAVKTIIDVNTINPLLTFTKRSTRCLFLRLKLNLFCTRGKMK